MKSVFSPIETEATSHGSERITIQFRHYDQRGRYSNSGQYKNATIHLKNVNDIPKAFELVKEALSRSGKVIEVK